MALLLSMSACVPQKSTSPASSGKSSSEDLLTISSVQVGSSPTHAAITYAGNYYSNYSGLVVMSGTCASTVISIKVSDTPQGGSASTQIVNCIHGVFSWSKSITTETVDTLVFTPLYANGIPILGASPLTKSYTYDTTPPSTATFLTPSTSNSYTILTGATAIAITGQVLNEVIKLTGPFSIEISLTPDPDGIHKNFIYNATVTTSHVDFTFTGFDIAGNSSNSTMSIYSMLAIDIPVAAQELGGSHVVSDNVQIESTAGFMSEVTINNNVKHVTGSTGIIGNL